MRFETKLKIIAIWFGVSMLILLGWIVGKLTGLIHSPVWVEVLPHSTAFSVGVSLAFFGGVMVTRMGNLESSFSTYRKKNEEEHKEFQGCSKNIEKRLTAIETKMEIVLQYIQRTTQS